MVGIFLFLLSIILATSLGVAAFVLMVNSDQNFAAKQIFKPKRQVVLITPEGDIIDTKEGLDVELEVLNQKLREKQEALIKSKERISSTLGNIQRLVTTKHEISKHFANLKFEIDKAERDCKELKTRISSYNVKKEAFDTFEEEKDDVCQKMLDLIHFKKDEDRLPVGLTITEKISESLPPLFESEILGKM